MVEIAQQVLRAQALQAVGPRSGRLGTHSVGKGARAGVQEMGIAHGLKLEACQGPAHTADLMMGPGQPVACQGREADPT